MNIYSLPTGMNCKEQTEALPGFSIEAPAGVRVQRGLCVRIPCNFTVGPGYTLTRDAIGIWYKGYNGFFNKSIVAASTDSSQFPDTTNGRFIFTGKVSAGDCSFSIRDAQPGDTDWYQFRLEDRDGLKFNYLGTQPSVSVTDLKGPDISPTEGLIAGEEVTLTCSAPTNCPGLSPTFTWEGSVNTERTQSHTLRHKDGNFSYWSDITFTPSPSDHSPLSCTVTYKHGSAKANITVNVHCKCSFHHVCIYCIYSSISLIFQHPKCSEKVTLCLYSSRVPWLSRRVQKIRIHSSFSMVTFLGPGWSCRVPLSPMGDFPWAGFELQSAIEPYGRLSLDRVGAAECH
uniref:Ig-like domain-containing protein n=1 Tax=Xenopus tropicalis TaxID=8364 RepID=A0A803JHT9_XENTR